MSVPGAAIDARQNRIASVPYCWFSATGSSPVPLDLDIFSPPDVRTSACKYTAWNGTLPVKWMPSMIIRATQKNRMSYPVIIKLVGYYFAKSAVFSGQPSVENGHSPELNQVSRTSGSCSRFVDPHVAHFAGASRITVTCLFSLQYHAGIRCPHQSCRDNVQSRIFLIQLKYSSRRFSGTIRISPCSTASIAGPASGFILQNHCVEARGSTIVLLRSHNPTACVYSVTFSSNPWVFKSSTIFFRASKRSMPA